MSRTTAVLLSVSISLIALALLSSKWSSSRTYELESSRDFWRHDLSLYSQPHKTAETARISERHTAHRGRGVVSDQSANSQKKEQAASTNADGNDRRVMARAMVPKKLLNEAYRDAYKQAYRDAMHKEEQKLEVEVRKGEQAQRELALIRDKAQLRGLTKRGQQVAPETGELRGATVRGAAKHDAARLSVRVPGLSPQLSGDEGANGKAQVEPGETGEEKDTNADVEQPVEGGQKEQAGSEGEEKKKIDSIENELQAEQDQVDKDKKELGLVPVKTISWGSSALGAPSHMQKGPHYTGGVEHFGSGYVHCPAGNCEPLERARVNVDSWTWLPKIIPVPQFDPSMDYRTRRAQNQRNPPRWARYNTGNNAAQWGAAYDPFNDPSGARLEKHGVNVRSKGYKAIPLPAFDSSSYDDAQGRSVIERRRSAQEVLQSERDHDAILRKRGVNVHGYPYESEPQTYTHADGISDKLVHVIEVPQYRNKGVAEFEQPSHFLLRDEKSKLREKQLGKTVHGNDVVRNVDGDNDTGLAKAGVNVDEWPDRLGQLFNLR